MRVLVLPDAATHAEAVSGLVVETVAGSEGTVDVGLAGGSTPAAAYRRLAGAPIAWDRVRFWLSDERWVPPDHPDSNGAMALDALGDQARVIRPRHSETLLPDEAATFYEAELHRLLPGGRSRLVLLGMGADGHTASLFPGTEALDEKERWYTAIHVPSLGAWRLTATYRLLHRAHRVLVVATGEAKAPTVAAVLEGGSDLPAARLADGEGELIWVLDQPAASLLSATEVERPLGR